MKLNEVTAEYEKILQRSCEGMENAWDDRLRMMNNIVARIINFQVCDNRCPWLVARVPPVCPAVGTCACIHVYTRYLLLP